MYELKNGTERLVNALSQILDDDYRLKAISEALAYYKPQLIDDIHALRDYYRKMRGAE